jgi:hypothetical protein
MVAGALENSVIGFFFIPWFCCNYRMKNGNRFIDVPDFTGRRRIAEKRLISLASVKTDFKQIQTIRGL